MLHYIRQKVTLKNLSNFPLYKGKWGIEKVDLL